MSRGITRAALLALFTFLASNAFSAGSGEQVAPATASGTAARSGVYPMTVTDDIGNSMTITSKPKTIISLSLFSDEVLFDLVEPARFAGASSLAADPNYSNVADRAAAVKPRVDFNVEQIIGIGPDIVFAANWSEAEKIAQLRKSGIVVYQFNTPFSVDGIIAAITDIAKILDETEAGAALVARMKKRISALEAVISKIPESSRAASIDYNNWGTANGKDTTWNEVLRLAGVANATAAFQAGDFGQVPMSKELLVQLDPEVIFLPGYIWGDDNAANAFKDQVLKDPAFAGLKAIKSQRVYAIPEYLKGTYSQYLVDAAELVAKLVYPDHF